MAQFTDSGVDTENWKYPENKLEDNSWKRLCWCFYRPWMDWLRGTFCQTAKSLFSLCQGSLKYLIGAEMFPHNQEHHLNARTHEKCKVNFAHTESSRKSVVPHSQRLRREGFKENPLNLWSWSYLAGPPSSFLRTVIALSFFCAVF